MKKQLLRIRLCQEKGNGLLEALIYMPLVLFFLFVATDAGLFFYEKSALADAFRVGVATQTYHSKKSPLYIDSYHEIRVDDAVLRDVLNGVVKEVSDAVGKIKTSIDRSDFKVRASGVVFDVNIETGQLTGYDVKGRAESSGSFNLQTEAPRYPYLSMDDYLSVGYEKASSIVPSNLAIPTSPIVNPETGKFESGFYNKSLAIYVELTVLTNGIARSAVKSSLGEYFAIQKQQLALARLQNG